MSRLRSGKEADRLYRKRSGRPSVRLLGCSRYREECWLFVDTTPSLTSRAALSCTGASSPVGAYGIGWRETHRKSLWRWLMLQLHSFKTLSASKPSGEKTPTTLRKLKLQNHLTPTSTPTLQGNSKYPHVLHFQTKTWREEELARLKDPETIEVTVPLNSVRQSF